MELKKDSYSQKSTQFEKGGKKRKTTREIVLGKEGSETRGLLRLEG